MVARHDPYTAAPNRPYRFLTIALRLMVALLTRVAYARVMDLPVRETDE